MDEERESTISEIEALESIFIHELNVTKDSSGWPREVSIHLVPSTGDNSDEQYVKFTLVLSLSHKYPNEAPKIQIKNPRGLSEDHLTRIMDDLNKIAKENKGLPVIYRLIEAGKEHLTRSNTPSEACAICLYEFCPNDHFTKTECYHYFHNFCLAQHVNHGLAHHREEVAAAEANSANAPLPKLEIVCPVCRLPISYNHLLERKFPPPQESLADTDYVISKDMAELQEKMKSLYCHQKERGGIIDMEAERNRFLLSISRGPNAAQASALESKYPENGEEKVERIPSSSTVAGSRHHETRPSGGRHRHRFGPGHRKEPLLQDFITNNVNSNQWHRSEARLRNNRSTNANKNSNSPLRTREPCFESRPSDSAVKPSTSQASIGISELDATSSNHRGSQNTRRRNEDAHYYNNQKFRKHKEDRYGNSNQNEDIIPSQVYNRHRRKNGYDEHPSKSNEKFFQDKDEAPPKNGEPSFSKLNPNSREGNANPSFRKHKRKKEYPDQQANASSSSMVVSSEKSRPKEILENGESTIKMGSLESSTNSPPPRNERYASKEPHPSTYHPKEGDRHENSSVHHHRNRRHVPRSSPKENSHGHQKLDRDQEESRLDNNTHRKRGRTKQPPPGFPKLKPPPGFENASLESTIKCSSVPPGFQAKQ